MQSQGCSRHVWVVRFISTLQLRDVWGLALPANFWNLEAKRLPLIPFLGQCDALQRPDHSLISQATPFADANLTSHTLRRWGLRDYSRSLGRTERCWKSSVLLFTAISQVSTCHPCACGPCMGVCWAESGNMRLSKPQVREKVVWLKLDKLDRGLRAWVMIVTINWNSKVKRCGYKLMVQWAHNIFVKLKMSSIWKGFL